MVYVIKVIIKIIFLYQQHRFAKLEKGCLVNTASITSPETNTSWNRSEQSVSWNDKWDNYHRTRSTCLS